MSTAEPPHTGPEHYAEAERIARAAASRDVANHEGFTGWARSDLAALAQVHATLAAVSSNIEAAHLAHYGELADGTRESWVEALR